MKSFKFKIKTTIFGILVTIVIAIVSIMGFFQYKLITKSALLATKATFHNLVEKSIKQIETYQHSSKNFLEIVEKIKDVTKPLDISSQHILLPIITNYIKNNKYIYAIYLGYKNDDFYIVYNLNISEKMKLYENSPYNAFWLIKKNKKQNNKIVSYKTFLDKDLKPIKTIKEFTTYKPTQRPWYKKSIKSLDIIKTKPYIFTAIGESGVTYAKNIDNNTVLSVDITLNSLNKILQEQKLVEGSGTFIYTKDGEVSGYKNNVTNSKIKNIKDSFGDIFIKDGKVIELNQHSIVNIKGKDYIKYTTIINDKHNITEYLSIISPLDTIMEPYNKEVIKAFLFTIFALFLLIIPFIYIMVQTLSKPILRLQNENKKIEDGNFEDIEQIDSITVEISDLSKSFKNMAKSIKDKNISIQKQTDELNLLLSLLDRNIIFSKIDLKGNITHISEAFCKISGYEVSELIGKKHDIMNYTSKVSSDFDNIWKSLKNNKTVELEMESFRKDGSSYWIKSKLNIDYDLDGKQIGYSEIRVDITDKKAVEELTSNLEIKIEERTSELALEKSNVEQILANILLPVIITSKNRRVIVYANKFAQDLYEISENEILNKPLDEVYKLKNGPTEVLNQLEKFGKVYGLEQTITTHTNKIFIALLSVNPITYNDEECYIGITADITKQKNMENEIRAIHRHTRDSIEYASMIQSALLPREEHLHNYFKDFFVHWVPKDTVGGDIWLFDSLRDENECLLFFIDCTGHGVPGAFVTMIVKAIEREIITKIKEDSSIDVSPAYIMSYFNKTMKELLKQETKESKSNAGFDGGIIYYNKKDKILKFSGAETPLFYVDIDGSFHTIKGDRYSVGYKTCSSDYEYKETIIDVKEGMKFYCTTDGYIDQNGGHKDFPFGKKRFSNIIKDNHLKPMDIKKQIFLEEMDKYEKMIENNDRNDDITVIGFEI